MDSRNNSHRIAPEGSKVIDLDAERQLLRVAKLRKAAILAGRHPDFYMAVAVPELIKKMPSPAIEQPDSHLVYNPRGPETERQKQARYTCRGGPYDRSELHPIGLSLGLSNDDRAQMALLDLRQKIIEIDEENRGR